MGEVTKGSSRRSQLEWPAEGYASAYQTSDQRAQDLPYWTHQYNLHRPTRQPKINAAHISRLGLTGDNLLRHHGEEVPESDAPQAAILTVQWSDFVMYRTLTNMIVSKRSMIIALVLFTMCIHTPLIASAQTTDQIQLLLNQIRDLPQRLPILHQQKPLAQMSFSGILTLGSRGGDELNLQTILKSQGYYTYPSVAAPTPSLTSTITPKPPDTIPPTIPTNLSASPVSPTQINLTWTASTSVGVTGYNIYRNGGYIYD